MWLLAHVSLMPSPPNSFHNSAGTGEAATCRRTAQWHQGRGGRREAECGGGKRWSDSKERQEEEMGSVKVRENPQVTASVCLFHHLVPVGSKTWPTLPRSCHRLSIVPLVPWKDDKLFTLCCVLLCAKYCSFPHIFSYYFHTLLLLVTNIVIVPVFWYVQANKALIPFGKSNLRNAEICGFGTVGNNNKMLSLQINFIKRLNWVNRNLYHKERTSCYVCAYNYKLPPLPYKCLFLLKWSVFCS